MIPQTLTTMLTPQPLHLVKWCKQVVALFDRHYVSASIVVGAENGSSVRRFTIQVVNRLNIACHGLFPVRVTVGTSATGGPSGTQTVTTITGTQIATVAANQCADVMTATDGTIVIDVEVTGAGTRHVTVSVGSQTVSTGAVTWA